MYLHTRKLAQIAVALVLSTALAVAADTKSQSFSVPTTWNIPAATLPPGTYSISIVDQMADRAIVTINNADGSIHSTFIAIPNQKVPVPARSGPVMWTGNGDSYVRGWRFPGDARVLEFAYPKAVAVSIARREQSAVPAVDPDSEGMKAVPNALASKSDMEVISLWLLSAKQVGPDPEKAEIKAARYEAGAYAAEPKHVAAVTAKRLPKTASELPVVLLFAFLSFGLALSVRYIRKSQI